MPVSRGISEEDHGVERDITEQDGKKPGSKVLSFLCFYLQKCINSYGKEPFRRFPAPRFYLFALYLPCFVEPYFSNSLLQPIVAHFRGFSPKKDRTLLTDFPVPRRRQNRRELYYAEEMKYSSYSKFRMESAPAGGGFPLRPSLIRRMTV